MTVFSCDTLSDTAGAGGGAGGGGGGRGAAKGAGGGGGVSLDGAGELSLERKCCLLNI